jgi:hypothetical protein
VKDLRKLVSALLSFLFSTEEQMGYDPSVTRHLDKTVAPARTCYVYRIKSSTDHPRHFKTLRSLSEYHEPPLIGRSTRVFEVVEIPSSDELRSAPNARSMVLKDSSVSVGQRTERQIQDDVFTRLRELARGINEADDVRAGPLDPRDPGYDQLLEILRTESWGRYFLTIVAEHVGPSTRVAPKSTPDAGRMRSHPQSQCAPLSVEAKRPYRVVFEEHCTPLHDLTDFSEVCSTMLDCLTGELLRINSCEMTLTTPLSVSTRVLGGLRPPRHQQREPPPLSADGWTTAGCVERP